MSVLKGKIRGHGRALASYLLTQGDNEAIRILDVDGAQSFTEQEFRDLLGDMSLNEQLTRSKQGLYHASINPEETVASKMSDADWLHCADILGEELKFTGQRRAIVLHTKYGRRHAHIIYERYSHETGKMIPIDHNFRKHDKARARIEAHLQSKPTPRRNPNRPAMQAALTAMWHETPDAKSFIRKAREQGYTISTGFDKIPYMVVDRTGRSFSLTRHLEKIRVKEVRERFKDTTLPSEKEAIAFSRTQQAITGQNNRPVDRSLKTIAKPGKEKTKREAFSENLSRIRDQQQQRPKGPRMK